MISDFVKGKKKFEYPPQVQWGITLHRQIDAFTDTHPATEKAKQVFRADYRLYSGALMDVIYDHFLANDEQVFSDASLNHFTKTVYQTLEDNLSLLPGNFVHLFNYMKQQDWLYHYRTMAGTKKGLGGVMRRAAYLTETDRAFELFTEHYQLLGDCYRQFIPDILAFARDEFDKLITG